MKLKHLIIFLLVSVTILLVPFTSYAKQSGYFQLSKSKHYVEYRINGKKTKNLTVKKGKKTYKIVNGRVKKINGKNEGTVKTRAGKIIYLKNGKTFNGMKSKKYYVNGQVDKKATGYRTVKNKKLFFKKGILLTGLYKNKYFKNGVFQNTFTGIKKINGKKFFLNKGKLFNGFYNKRIFVNGRVDKTVNGYKTIKNTRYYFIKGIVSDPTIKHPLKILMVGNSYTYYNGYPQMLSKMIAKTKKSAIVVRATCGGLSLNDLMTSELSYAAFKDGEVIKSGSKTMLKEIINMDFGNLKRAGKWDYIISQNNGSTSTIKDGDVKFYKMIKGNIVSSKRYIIHGMYYSGSTSSTRYEEHMKAAEECKCSILDSNSYYKGYKAQFGTKWTEELTIMDDPKHPSGRGGYLLALCIYAKLFGINSFASTETDSHFIALYNSEGGNTKEFAPNKYKAKNATVFAMSVTKSEAKKLQAYVRFYSDTYIGNPLYIQDYVL